MMTFTIIVCGLFSLCATVVIDAIRIVNSLEKRGEEVPTDRLDLARLWYRYWDDEL